MDTIKAARELGKAIQSDARYKKFIETKEKNDSDTELQELIGGFNLKRQNLQLEATKADRDQEKIRELNADIQATYAQIMQNENMAFYTIAKDEMDSLIKEVNGIINLCCEGADPDTAEYVPASACGGSCSGCAGCG